MFQVKEYMQDRFIISANRNKVCEFLERSYWANNRKGETIVKSIEHYLLCLVPNGSVLFY
ncbi:hypothetical protein B9L23_09990 [Parageobacillus galactosidasius]|uniref:Uncharacterized protein n=1 Tax=Parageobacillus galactosidasius TaxID=883812 RepID=A0A226QJ24_9BACL|nr:hypothetical protein B9L23_09990 [Parageobacillus galactosidasius]